MSVTRDPGCLFCRIISGEIPSSKVYESDHVVAFRDIQPAAPVHVLVVPRTHVRSVHELSDVDDELAHALMTAIARVASEQGIADDGYRVVTNVGAWGGQTVHHLHFHILGGRQLGTMG